MMSVFSKVWGRVWLTVFFGTALVGLFFIFTRYNPFNSELRKIQKQEKAMQEMLEREKNDTYGGFTPEETLRLFIDALKKGDTDLAAKYFVIDKQEEWNSYIDKIKSEGNLLFMIQDAESLKLNKIEESEAFFTIAKNNIVEVQVILNKSSNGRWKISEL